MVLLPIFFNKELSLKPDIIRSSRIKMKITLDNFSEVKRMIAKDGIKKVNYDTRGNAISFTMKDDKEFELDPMDFKSFEAAELLGFRKKLEIPVP